MLYDIKPVPKPRMTKGDKRRKGKVQRPEVARYWAFVDECRIKGVCLPVEDATVIFYMPMARSWPKAKKDKMRGKAMQQRPDLSNLLKALEDAVYTDDKTIWHYAGLAKVWSDKPGIQIITPDERPAQGSAPRGSTGPPPGTDKGIA